LVRLQEKRLDAEIVGMTKGCLLKDDQDLAETDDQVVAELVARAAAD